MGQKRPQGPLGRANEFERALAWLRPGAGVVVRGGRGSGRTTFASALTDAARKGGAAPLWITPTASLRDVPLGALCTLLDGDVPRSDTADALAAVVSAIRFHGGGAPTVLVVDDAHLLDDLSADAVLQACSSRAAAVVAVTDATVALPAALGRLIDDRFVDLVELAPFDRETTADVAASLLGGRPAAATVELLWRWSVGVPSVVTAIVETGMRDGRFEPAEGDWWWNGAPPAPDVVATWTERRIAERTADAADALGVVALAGWADAVHLEAITGATPLIELDEAGLVDACDHGAGLVLRCRDELVAPTIVAQMSPLRRRAIAQQLLDVLPAPRTPPELTRAARLYVHAGTPPPADVLIGAASVLRLSDPSQAERIAAVNHRWAPSTRTAISLLMNRVEVGDATGARELLAAAESLVATPDDEWELVEARFAVALFAEHDPDAALATLAAVPPAAVDGAPGRVAEVRSLESLATLLSGRPDRAGRFARDVIDADASATATLRATVAAVAALLLAGRTHEARQTALGALATAEALAADMPSATGMLRAELAFIQLWRGELTPLPDAHPATGRWPTPPTVVRAATGAEPFTWALMAGIVAHLRGDHAEATARLREATVQQAQGKGLFHAEAVACLAVALCDAGDRTGAEAALQRFPAQHLAVLPGVEPWAGGVVACAAGRRDDGERLLREAAAEANEVGAFLCEARYLVELVERCDVADPLVRLDELASLVDAPLLQLLCRAAIARVNGDVGGLLECAALLADCGVSARSAAMCKEAERLARHSADERSVRRATRLRRQLATRTGDAGAEHPLLTRREDEVARLAAGGLTDREIAARLVVSVRTVESHLASAYRKLSVASRNELAAALA